MLFSLLSFDGQDIPEELKACVNRVSIKQIFRKLYKIGYKQIHFISCSFHVHRRSRQMDLGG